MTDVTNLPIILLALQRGRNCLSGRLSIQNDSEILLLIHFGKENMFDFTGIILLLFIDITSLQCMALISFII